MNQFQISGRLTRDPEMNGSATKFTVAVDGYNFSTKQREAQFFPVVAFGKLGDLVRQYTSKGREVVVWGNARENHWTDQNGQKRSRWEFIADGVDFVGGGGQGGQRQQGGGQHQGPPPSHRDDGDDGAFNLGEDDGPAF
jgi:single-strand DNA-binding protein